MLKVGVWDVGVLPTPFVLIEVDLRVVYVLFESSGVFWIPKV